MKPFYGKKIYKLKYISWSDCGSFLSPPSLLFAVATPKISYTIFYTPIGLTYSYHMYLYINL